MNKEKNERKLKREIWNKIYLFGIFDLIGEMFNNKT